MSTHPSIEERLDEVGRRQQTTDAFHTVALAGMVGSFLRAVHGGIWPDLWGSWERMYALLTDAETKAFDWRGTYERVGRRPLHVLTVAALVGDWLRGGSLDRPSIEGEIRRLRRQRAQYVATLVACELAAPREDVVSPDRDAELAAEAQVWVGAEAAGLPVEQRVAHLERLVERP